MKKIALLIVLLIVNYGGKEVFAKSLADDNSSPNYIPSITPPSPTAYKFSTFGNIPLNGSTGGFSYSIPIYTIKDKDITLPISVDYYSAGVKIDELSGIVGTDWNLNAGGVISRVMRGKPDEEAKRWYPQNISGGIEFDRKVNQAADIYTDIDTDRDWFSFNVNGISGTFYFDENLKPIVSSKDFVVVQYSTSGIFTIIDKEGYQYLFNEVEKIRSSSITDKNEENPPKTHISSWFLSKIISPLKNEITFVYKDNDFAYVPGTSTSLTWDTQCNGLGFSGIVFSYHDAVSFSNVMSKVLTEIQFSNQSVLFDYNTDRKDGRGVYLKNISIVSQNNTVLKKFSFEYDSEYTNRQHPISIVNTIDNIRYRLFLKSILLEGENKESLNQYTFDYYEKDKLPIRLSYSKDEFGYYNGADNSIIINSQVKKDPYISSLLTQYNGNSYVGANRETNPNMVYYGMLKQITYPTGGYTLINYEANSTIGQGTLQKYQETSLYVTKGNDIPASENSKTFTFTSNGEPIYFTASGELRDGESDYHDQYRIIIKNLTNNKEILNRSALFGEVLKTENFSSNDLLPIRLEKGTVCEVKIILESKDFNLSSANVLLKYNGYTTYFDQTIFNGGARVKEISDYTDDVIAIRRSFFYNKINLFPSLKTTLNNIIRPDLYIKITYPISCSSNSMIGKIILSSSDIDLHYNHRKQSSYYTAITEFIEKNNSGNGAIEREFHDITQDYAADRMYSKNILYAPYSNGSEAYSGLVIKESYFKKKDDKYLLKKKKEYNYTSLNLEMLSSYIFQKDYPLNFGYLYPFTLEDSIISISGSRYFNYVENVKCSSTLESIYENSDSLKIKTDYTYSGSPYFNLKKETTTNSDGSTQIKNYQYSPDLTGQLSNMDKLVTNNRVGIPITTESKTKNTAGTELQTTFTKTAYQEKSFTKSNGTSVNLLLPESIYTPTSTDKRITFTNYDEFGNIIYYILDDATKVVYLWGYNGQYPIAEIKNATYDQVKAALGVAPESLSSAAIPDYIKIEALRTNTNLLNALITTYTYKPLIGILTATDPRGVVTSYEYDSFNRLSGIKDANGKLINTYDYHYQNQ